MKKLPAEYRSLLRKKEQQQKGDLESVSKAAGVPDEVDIQFEFRDSLEPLMALGLRVTSQDGNFADGVVALSNLEALAAHPNIVRISRPPQRKKFLDKSIPDIHANQLWSRSGDTWSGNTGKDVIIGIVDTGIDYAHKTFRKADNSSRILSIWDQTLSPTAPHESSPGVINTPGGTVTLNFGVEYVREDAGNANRPTIKKALESSDPYSVVRHKDADGHGTHVAGIAGGDGSQSDACCGAYTYIGVAPEAEYIIVRLIGLTDGDPAAPAGSGNVKVNAIRYILDRANGRPCVINLSLGSDLGARDGSGIEEQRVESLVGQFANKMAVVQAASNDGNKKRHVGGAVPDNDTADIQFKIPTDSKSSVSVEVRYAGNHLDAAVKPPGRTFNAGDWQWISPGNHNDDLGYNGTGTVSLDNGDSETSVITVMLSPPTDGSNVSGVWTLRLRNNTSADTDINGWCNEGITFKPISDEAPIQVSPHSTISPDASGKNVIVVGAYATEGTTNGQLAGFSSRGPALDTNQTAEQNIRPHISAPGVAITSAATDKYRNDSVWDTICCCDCCQDFYINQNGTSMATPHVVGAAALMFQKNNDLDWTQILDFLKNSVRTDIPDDSNKIPPLPNNNWGWGKIDVKAAVDAVPASGGGGGGGPIPFAGGNGAMHFGSSRTDLLALREEFFSIPKTKFYQELVVKHFQDVRALINTNKRVATVWHRNGGPAIIRAGMQAAFQPEQPLPMEIEGVSLTERLSRIMDILKKYGSEVLNSDIEEHVKDKLWILREGFSVRQLLDLFKEQESEAASHALTFSPSHAS